METEKFVVRYRPEDWEDIIVPADEGDFKSEVPGANADVGVLIFVTNAADVADAAERLEDEEPGCQIVEVLTAADYLAKGGVLPNNW